MSSLPNGLHPRGAQVRALDLLHLLEIVTIGLPDGPEEPCRPGLAAPNPTVTAQALAPGSTPYAYRVTAIAALGVVSTASGFVQVLNVASLSNAAFNRINWAPVPDAVGYTVSRTTGGPGQGVIAVVPAGALLECNPVGALVPPSFPLLPPYQLHDTGLPVIVAP